MLRITIRIICYEFAQYVHFGVRLKGQGYGKGYLKGLGERLANMLSSCKVHVAKKIVSSWKVAN